jgi:hypothetical protein
VDKSVYLLRNEPITTARSTARAVEGDLEHDQTVPADMTSPVMVPYTVPPNPKQILLLVFGTPQAPYHPSYAELADALHESLGEDSGFVTVRPANHYVWYVLFEQEEQADYAYAACSQPQWCVPSGIGHARVLNIQGIRVYVDRAPEPAPLTFLADNIPTHILSKDIAASIAQAFPGRLDKIRVYWLKNNHPRYRTLFLTIKGGGVSYLRFYIPVTSCSGQGTLLTFLPKSQEPVCIRCGKSHKHSQPCARNTMITLPETQERHEAPEPSAD